MCSYTHYTIGIANLQGVLFLLHLHYRCHLPLFFVGLAWYTYYIETTKGDITQ